MNFSTGQSKQELMDILQSVQRRPQRPKECWERSIQDLLSQRTKVTFEATRDAQARTSKELCDPLSLSSVSHGRCRGVNEKRTGHCHNALRLSRAAFCDS